MKLEFSRQILVQYSNNKLYENPFFRSRVVHADKRPKEQTDSHDETNNRLSKFCERA